MSPAAVLGPCPRPLQEAHDVALLDLDGVVHLGDDVVASAPAALAAARAAGMRLAFTTNNSSRTPAAVARRLTGMGVPCEVEDVVTSAQASATLLAERLPPGAAVLVVGGAGLHQAVAAAGLRLADGADDAVAVVQGYHPEVTYAALAEAALAVGRGALWVGSNGDATLPTPRGPLPGNGSLLALVATATGATPLLAGKPELPLHAEAVARTGARTPLVVGDRLDTDVEGAVRADAPSLLVLTGVVDAARLLAAPPGRRPTFLSADLTGLARPAPGAVLEGGWAVELSPDGSPEPEGWRWRVGSGGAEVVPAAAADGGEAAEVRSLRVLAVAVWAAGDAGEAVDVDAALQRWRAGSGRPPGA